MKSPACLLSPSTALARVFLTSAGPRQTGLLASYSYGSSNVHSYSTTATTTSHGSSVLVPQFLVPSGRPQHSVACQQRRCVYTHRGPPSRHPRPADAHGHGPPRSGPPRSGPPRASPGYGGHAGHGGHAAPRPGLRPGPRPGPPRSGPPRLAPRRSASPQLIDNGDGNRNSNNRYGESTSGGGLKTSFGPAQSGNAPRIKVKMARMPRNNEITHSHVLVRQEDGTLGLPECTEDVLRRINRKTHALVVVAMPKQRAEEDDESRERRDEENDQENDRNDGNDSIDQGNVEANRRQTLIAAAKSRYPVCRIIDIEVERKAEAERTKAERKKNVGSKELELNWAIDPHDLGHRLNKLREFLSKGMFIEVRLLRKSLKRGKRQATLDEANEVLRRIRETMAEVPGSVDAKASEGEVLRMMKLFLKGPEQK